MTRIPFRPICSLTLNNYFPFICKTSRLSVLTPRNWNFRSVSAFGDRSLKVSRSLNEKMGVFALCGVCDRLSCYRRFWAVVCFALQNAAPTFLDRIGQPYLDQKRERRQQEIVCCPAVGGDQSCSTGL